MSKNNLSLLCRVKKNHGLEKILTEDGFESTGKLTIETSKGKEFELLLKDIWAQAVEYTWIGSQIMIHYFKKDVENKQLILDMQGYFILEPDVLVSPSSIRNSESCIRKYYVQRRLSAMEKNYPMLRGTLVNNAFDILVNDKSKDKKSILDKVLKDGLIDLSSLEEHNLPEPHYIRAELTQHLNALAVWKTHKKFLESERASTEPTVISRKYGLSGRLDLLVNPGKEAVTYELKTGKAPDTNPWRNDIYQVACYQLLLESSFECTNPDSYVIYSKGRGNDLLKQCSIDYKTRRMVINTRNRVVSIDYALQQNLDKKSDFRKFIPPTGIGNCETCLVRTDCFALCGKFEEKACDSCNVNQICKNGEKSVVQQDLDYYSKYFQLIEFERQTSRKNFSRIFSDIKPILEEGKVILNLNFVDLDVKMLTLKTEEVIESEIKPGDMVLLYNDKIVRGEVFKATVKYIDRNNIHLALKKEAPIEFFREKIWNIYIDTMETTFDTMNGALYSFLSNKNLKKRDLILGRRKPAFAEVQNIQLDESLNQTQKNAIKKALSAKDYFLIQGPPGTGKTHTLANLIIKLIEKGNKVLLSAFTHRSIDNVLAKVIELGFEKFLRIGSHESVDQIIHPYLIQERFKEKSFEDIKDIQKELNDFPLVACSSITAMSSSLIKRMSFDVSVVDEAGQLTEPGTLSVILQSDKFILVGDHKQLPPVVQSNEAKEQGLSQSLFERLININRENQKDVMVTLDEQYRMNENIMEYSNKNFYDFKLKAHEKIAKQVLKFNRDISESKFIDVLAPENNMVFIDIKGECSMKNNITQAKFITSLVENILEHGIEPEKIGVITPFRAQVAEIKREFFTMNNPDASRLTVDTVDRFQGSDRDIIIFSSVISKIEQVTDFFTDYRRINVSVTRAKKKFILIGNKDVLVKSDLFYKLIRLSKEVNIDF